MKWEVFGSRGCNIGDGGEEVSLGETASLQDNCAMLSNGGYNIFQKRGQKLTCEGGALSGVRYPGFLIDEYFVELSKAKFKFLNQFLN